MKYIFFLISLSFGYDKNYLMDSEDMPFEGDLVTCQIFRSFYPKCRLSDYDLLLVTKYGEFYDLSPLLYFVKFEQENNLTKNINNGHTMSYEVRYQRALAFWLWEKKNEGFEKQIQLFSWQMNQYRKAYKGPGLPFKLDADHGIVYPISIATFMLYKYTPFYGIANNCGYVNVGNRNFELIYQEFKPKWKLALKVKEQVKPYLLTDGKIPGIITLPVITNFETNIPAYPPGSSNLTESNLTKEVLQ